RPGSSGHDAGGRQPDPRLQAIPDSQRDADGARPRHAPPRRFAERAGAVGHHQRRGSAPSQRRSGVMARIDQLFPYLKPSKGSDLHFGVGVAPRIRRHGSLEAVPDWAPFDDAGLRQLLYEIANPKQKQEYERTGDLDFAYGLQDVARFRCNFFVEGSGA